MKITLALLFGSVLVAVAAAAPGGTQISVDAPPPKELSRKAPPKPAGRGKRSIACGTPTRLPAAEQQKAIDAHNLFRSKEPASNMKKVKYNEQMAAIAQAWADKCQWEHGMLYDCDNNRIGQNLAVEASAAGYPPLNMTHFTDAWNNERNDWNFQTQTCAPGKLCGHWTQLADADSIEVGCAYNLCPTMNVAGQIWNNAIYIVCDYTPPGNVMGEPMFVGGPTCSNCDAKGTGKGYKCENNLCVECTPAADSSCKCGTPLACQNEGTWSASTCSCQCKKGFYGLSCETPCACDTDANCPAWEAYCNDEGFSAYMAEYCKGTCKLPCTLPPQCTA